MGIGCKPNSSFFTKFSMGEFFRLFLPMVLLLLIGIILISGCTRPDRTPPGKRKIEFWTISLKPTYDDYIGGIIRGFEQEHPHVHIEWIDMPQSAIMQKLMASIAGDVSPDVVNLNPGYTSILAQNLALSCMDEHVDPADKALYFPNLWESSNFEGRSYGIPWYVTTRVVMYNTEIFEKAGLDPAKPPKTWEEVEQYSRQIREKTGIYGYMPAIKIFEDFQMQGVPIVSEDKKKALFNTPEGAAVLQWYVDMKEDGVIPVETLSEGYQGALNRYQSGNLAMIIAGPTLLMRIQKDAPEVYKKTAVAPMPLGKAGVIPAATMNLVVPRGSKNRRDAVDFALYVTNNANQLEFCKLVPLLPSTIEATQDDSFRTGKGEPLQDEAIRISLDQLSLAVDMSLGLKDSSRLSRIMHEAVEASYYRRKTASDALGEAAERWNRILAETL